MIGKRFSNLVILSIEAREKGHVMLSCKCDCGNTKLIRRSHVLSGAQKGCGCGRAHTLRHGKAGTGIYFIWRSMRDRCENLTSKAYSHYGARGIYVCERWKIFDNFYADMGDKPAGMSLERSDNDGNYEPGNVRWATRTDQNNNTTRNIRVCLRSTEMTLAQAIRLSGCKTPERTVRGRVDRGWDIETAMNHQGHLR